MARRNVKLFGLDGDAKKKAAEIVEAAVKSAALEIQRSSRADFLLRQDRERRRQQLIAALKGVLAWGGWIVAAVLFNLLSIGG